MKLQYLLPSKTLLARPAQNLPTAEPWLDAEREVADTVGRLMEFWGFKRHMGRIWTVLYLSPEPLSAPELGDRLSLSGSAVSTFLGELSRWRAVKKTWRPGERRDFWEAEGSLWKLVRRVVARRELTLVHEATESFLRAEAALDVAGRGADRATRKRLAFVRRRLRHLTAFSRVGRKLLEAVVATEPLDLHSIEAAGDGLDAEQER